MNTERFEALAEAFGGEVSRWPAAERDGAAALMLARPDWAGGVLALAGELDVQLRAFAAPRAEPGLAERIVSRAPRPRKSGWMAWLLPASMGVGLAAASVAGFIVGIQLAPNSDPTAMVPSTVSAAVDDDFGFDLEEEV
jgi:hypothetical protein